jgi:hypothetical protein
VPSFHIATQIRSDSLFHGSKDATEEHINERVHWSVIAKHKGILYNPPNLPAPVPFDKIAAITAQERMLLGQEP